VKGVDQGIRLLEADIDLFVLNDVIGPVVQEIPAGFKVGSAGIRKVHVHLSGTSGD